MEIKSIRSDDLPKLISRWAEDAEVFIPREAKGFISFTPTKDGAGFELTESRSTRYPPKAFFLPQSEAMFTLRGSRLESVPPAERKRVVVGTRPCDARASALLDLTLAPKDDADPLWQARRAATALVSFGCIHPAETCFCQAVESGPFDPRGSDVLVTPLADGFTFQALTKTGEALIAHLPAAEKEMITQAEAVQKKAASVQKKPFDTPRALDKMYALFETDFWTQQAASCLGCGVCTFLCPTCFCFDIVDETSRAQRVRNWDSCMFRIYSQEASGHNPRPTKTERTRQRVMHKYAYWIEQVNEVGCTGCGRCVQFCPVNIDIRSMVRQAQTMPTDTRGGKK